MSGDDPIAELISGTARQERVSFSTLYSAASAKLFGVALRILKDRAEAEDAVQEVFTRVWLNAHRYDAAKARGMTWLITIARNHAIDRLRARPSANAAPEEMLAVRDSKPSAETQIIAKGEARRIGECFETLEPAKAEAIRGAYLSGMSYEDLSKRHDVPLNTMRSWLRRGLLKLKECMEG